MAWVLDLHWGANRLFSSFGRTDDWFNLGVARLQSGEQTSAALQSVSQGAGTALRAAFLKSPSAREWEVLLRAGERIAALLPEGIVESLIKASRSGDPTLVLRLPEELVAIPWELLRVNDQLLGELFRCGRQLVRESVAGSATSATVHQSVTKVLIVADRNLGWAMHEANVLLNLLRPHPELQVTLYSNLAGHELLDALSVSDVLHFAGHAVADPDDQMRMAWLLRDGPLGAHILRTVGRARWPSLVFANTCSPTEARERTALRMDEVGRLMLDNGARLVQTVAPVPDSEYSAAFAAAFYRLLLKQVPAGMAVQHARRYLARWHGVAGRLVAAHYVYYGSPAAVFRSPQVNETAHVSPVDDVVRAEEARLQGRVEDARTHLQQAADRLQEAGPSTTSAGKAEVERRLVELEKDSHSRENVATVLREGGILGAPALPVDFGSYGLLEVLSEGDYSILYKASSANPAIPLSPVVVSLPHDRRPNLVASQLRSFGELVPRLDHDGLAKLLAVGEIGGVFYTVHEYVEGLSLDHAIQLSPDPWKTDEALAVVELIGSALAHAHSRGVYHGELSPADILLTVQPDNSRRVKILECGRAEALHRAGLRIQHKLESQPYRSPEQWAVPTFLNEVGPDLWALGVIAYRLLAGKHPFEHCMKDNTDWARALQTGQAFPALQACPDLSADLASWLHAALAISPRDRFQSMIGMLQALRRARQGREWVGGFDPDMEIALDAGCRLLYVLTEDEYDTLDHLRRIALARDLEFYQWSLASGLQDALERHPLGADADLNHTITWLEAQDRPVFLALLDFDIFLDDGVLSWDRENPEPYHETWGIGASFLDDSSTWCSALHLLEENPRRARAVSKEVIIRFLREIADDDHFLHKIIILSAALAIPPELSKTVQVFAAQPVPPDKLEQILVQVAGDRPEWAPEFVLHSIGRTASDVKRSLDWSRARRGSVTHDAVKDVQREKEQEVRKQGLLEVHRAEVCLSDVVGLENFKAWISAQGALFRNPLLLAVTPHPSGILLGGMPGCGKSFCAQAVAGEFGWPLLRLDFGRIFTGLLGGAEANLRTALSQVTHLSPLVLWLDDIDMAFGDRKRASGGTNRVLQFFLTWLQEHDDLAFLVATANDPLYLPPEMIRAGRFDCTMFLDWPEHARREAMLRHLLTVRYGRDGSSQDFSRLASDAEGASAADLLAAVEDALWSAASNARPDPSSEELSSAIEQIRGRSAIAALEPRRQLWLSMAIPA